MDPLTAVAASGLRSRMESLEMLANNVANASTGGYKSDREFYSLYADSEAQTDGYATMPVIERPWTDLSQGVLTATGNPLDLALSGKGFFAVNGPSGPLYTRNGSFQLAKDGTLVTADGYPLREARGGTLLLQGSGPVSVSSDGTVMQDGNIVGQLDIRNLPATGLAKRGSNYFLSSDPNLQPVAAGDTSVSQGRLEASNAGSAESAVRLIGIMRQFEMLQKAASLGMEMSQHAIQDVAKVGA
ncbi:MAG: flagellar hook basal-body protein [Acidobacteriia bacterium]|nr:flagellar hook basal-body protein [Terriglobia bacterium]MBV8903992.1 flagellar hook basal-body protein [Terriglobia bacterium]MBV9746660.1 flagellar hook basal-body protein [Terriglobia bacterium]